MTLLDLIIWVMGGDYCYNTLKQHLLKPADPVKIVYWFFLVMLSKLCTKVAYLHKQANVVIDRWFEYFDTCIKYDEQK